MLTVYTVQYYTAHYLHSQNKSNALAAERFKIYLLHYLQNVGSYFTGRSWRLAVKYEDIVTCKLWLNHTGHVCNPQKIELFFCVIYTHAKQSNVVVSSAILVPGVRESFNGYRIDSKIQ